LSWFEPSNNGGTSIKGYEVIRENSCTGNFISIYNTTNSSLKYSDTGLAANTCFKYNVKAINAIGVGNASANNVTVTTLSVPVTTRIPNSPTGLNISKTSSTSLKLTWITPSDNGGLPITGYLIQRNGTSIIINTSTNKTSFTDTNLLPIHQQTYRVAAWNIIGLGSFSNLVSGNTNSTAILPLDNGTNPTSTNLGKLISDLEHKSNQLLKQQRQETFAIIHDCRDQIKNASSENKTQIVQACKIKIKESRIKYADLRHQINAELAKLKAQFNLQTHEDRNEEHSEKENDHSKNMTSHFKIKSEKQNKNGKHNQNRDQQGKNHGDHENED
jgi:hypothetical protein